MRIEVTKSGVDVVARLADLPSRALRAMQEGLYEGGDKVRTQVRRALKVQTGVKAYRSVTSRTSGVRAGLSYIIRGTGKGLPIEEFPVRVTGAGVAASPWGVSRVFKRSFRNGGYRARLTSKRFPVRRLYGPSIAKELVQDQSAEAFRDSAGLVADAIDKRLARLLG